MMRLMVILLINTLSINVPLTVCNKIRNLIIVREENVYSSIQVTERNINRLDLHLNKDRPPFRT